MTEPRLRPRLYRGRKASESLNIVIVGGGIAGLAAAFTLQTAGHVTTILHEHPEGATQRGGGEEIAPNAVKVLDDWGVGGELRKVSFQPKGISFRAHSDDSIIADNPWTVELFGDAGAPFLCIEHSKAHGIISRLAHSAGVKVLYNKRVHSLDLTTNTVSCADGSKYKAPLIIGADGVCSLVRKTIFPEADSHNESPMCVSGLIIPASEMRKDPELERLLDGEYANIWMGPSRSIWAYSLDNRKCYGLDCHYPNPNYGQGVPVTKNDTLWYPRELADVRGGWSDWNPRVRKLLSLIESTPSCTRVDMVPLEYYHYPCDDVDSSEESSADSTTQGVVAPPPGYVVLVGHAAHPVQPASVNGFGMAIEDAEVLGSLFSRYNPKKGITSIESLLNAYSEIRHERATAGIYSERGKSDLFTLPPDSEEAKMRNEAFKASENMGELPDGGVMGELSALWGCHAGDEAEDWWGHWRLPMERSEAAAEAAANGGGAGGEGEGGNSSSAGFGYGISSTSTVVSAA